MSSNKRDKWIDGNPRYNKHYWLSPLWLWERAAKLLGVTKEELFDPCPHPRPAGVDGLNSDWGNNTYVNPPFPTTEQLVKGKLETTSLMNWVAKSIQESRKGRNVALVLPVDRRVHHLVNAGAELYSVGDVRWEATEGGSATRRSARPIMAFILRGKKQTS